MLRFKSFIKHLNEELTPEQKKQVSTWERDPKALAHTDHFFGKGNDDHIEPLQGGNDKSEPHRAIERHLGHEISHEDYKAGKTKDKYGREVKIGSLLQKTKADPKLIQHFANDSTRQLKTQNNLTVHVTRSAAGVAGQTSRGQSWENESCKNFEDGSNRHYLEHEVKRGTVVAYLKNHHGHELARATFQPYHNDHGQAVYRHDSYYGPKVKEFQDHVEGLEKRLSASHEPNASLYKIHPDVYNDSGVRRTLHPNITSEHIHKALDDKDENVRRAAASYPIANVEHLHKALNDSEWSVRRAATVNPNATAEHLHKALNDSESSVRRAAAAHPNANAEQIHKGLDDKEEFVRQSAAYNRSASAEHIDKALSDEDWGVRETAAKHPNANAEHLHKALNDKDENVRRAAASHPNANAKHLHKALNNRSHNVRVIAAAHPNANAEHIDKALNDKNDLVRRHASYNPNANAEQIHKALNDKDNYIRRAAAKNPSANPTHIQRALDDDNIGVREAAAKHPNITSDQLHQALSDPETDVRSAAKNNPNYNKIMGK
jgi:HEAT repeat protein